MKKPDRAMRSGERMGEEEYPQFTTSGAHHRGWQRVLLGSSHWVGWVCSEGPPVEVEYSRIIFWIFDFLT